MSNATAVKTMADQSPEYYHYEDTGCEVSPSCLNCPLPQCKYDDPVWFQRAPPVGPGLEGLEHHAIREVDGG